MNEKRFTIHKESKYKEEWYAYPFCIKEDGEVVLETIPLSIAEKVRDKLNEQQSTISQLEEENDNMNLFIKQTIEPLLFNCVFELDTIESMSQVELARKIEDEIIPFIQDFKYLKYESLEEEKQNK